VALSELISHFIFDNFVHDRGIGIEEYMNYILDLQKIFLYIKYCEQNTIVTNQWHHLTSQLKHDTV